MDVLESVLSVLQQLVRDLIATLVPEGSALGMSLWVLC